MLNQNYGNVLERKADLYNWFYHIEDDEISYFLTEAGSNCFNYSQFKAPHQFLLWIGKNGFIIGIEQKGQGFNAKNIHDTNHKQNEGGAFEFYKRTKATIFFDNSESTKIVYMEVNFKSMGQEKKTNNSTKTLPNPDADHTFAL